MLTESEYILQPVQLSETTRRTSSFTLLLSLSHSPLFVYLSVSLFFFFFSLHLHLRRQTRARAGSRYSSYLSACCFSFFFRIFCCVFFFMLMEIPYRVPRSFRVLFWSLSLFLCFSFGSLLSLFICFFFFTKITEQHQHLFLLKPTPSSAGRPTKTEAIHFFSLIHSHLHTHGTHAHIRAEHTFAHKARTSSRKCARARFSIAVSLTFGKMDALRFASLLHSFVLLNILFFSFSPAI